MKSFATCPVWSITWGAFKATSALIPVNELINVLINIFNLHFMLLQCFKHGSSQRVRGLYHTCFVDLGRDVFILPVLLWFTGNRWMDN